MTKKPGRYKALLLLVALIVLLNLSIIFSISARIEETHTRTVVVEKEEADKEKSYSGNTTLEATRKIYESLDSAKYFFNNWKPSSHIPHDFGRLLASRNLSRSVQLWNVAAQWVTKDQIVPPYSPLLYNVIRSLERSPITQADITPKGTQLKIFLTLEGGQRALFKPKWYSPDTVIQGSVYSGKDRHNGEIAAFHLSRLLGLNRAPIVGARTLNLNTEILPVASPELNQTFYFENENTCLYGVCLYCKREEGVCGRGPLLEGSISLWLPERFELKKARHPWQRSYSHNPATWEMYADYCNAIKSGKKFKSAESRLLDLIETSVFDFLIDNGDRHHYEYFNNDNPRVLLIDNAKSFGNPNVDHIDILAPLYQCCRLRENLLFVLVKLQDGGLSKWLQRLLDAGSSLKPTLSEGHMRALERRLEKVLAAIQVCVEEKGLDSVLVPD